MPYLTTDQGIMKGERDGVILKTPLLDHTDMMQCPMDMGQGTHPETHSFLVNLEWGLVTMVTGHPMSTHS